MRTRASYRPVLSIIDIKCEKSDKIVKSVVKNIQTKRKSSSHSSDDKNIKVITISDSDEEEAQTTGVKESSGERPVINRCVKCLNSFETAIDYSSLTSADFYVNPRTHPSVLRSELSDKNRYNTYQKAILQNKHLFSRKVVLVVGSGVGLLALLAAKAGAQTVIVIDSKEIRELITDVINKNRELRNYSINDTNITVMNESIEDMVLPNGIEEVDIIVSDWVNQLLFFKSKIASFIYARDKWLKKGGLIFPDSANIYIAGAHDYIHRNVKSKLKYSKSVYSSRIDWWGSHVYGFDMNAIRNEALKEPYHTSIDRSQVVTDESLLKSFDFYNTSLKDLNFSKDFRLKAIGKKYLQMFVIYFEVIFTKNISVTQMFSTRPEAPKTCFKPSLFFLDNQRMLALYKNDELDGNLTFSLNEDLSKVIVNIDFHFKNQICSVKEKLEFRSA